MTQAAVTKRLFSSKCLNLKVSSKHMLEEKQLKAYATVVLR
jgi:hypothetical protein